MIVGALMLTVGVGRPLREARGWLVRVGTDGGRLLPVAPSRSVTPGSASGSAALRGCTEDSTSGAGGDALLSTTAQPNQATVTAIDVASSQAPAYPKARRISTP